MVRFWFINILLFVACIGQSQPVIINQFCYGTTQNDGFTEAITTQDSCILACSYYDGFDGDALGLYELSYPAILTKYDKNLNVLWQKYYGGTSGSTRIVELKELEDGSIICFGKTSATDNYFENNNGGFDMFLLKLNSFGDIIWSKCYGSPGSESAESVICTMDGGFLFSGYSNSSGGDIPFHLGETFYYDIILMKCDINGDIEWTKVLGGSGDDVPVGDLIELNSGMCILNSACNSEDYDMSDSGIDGAKRWLIKISPNGSIFEENIISATEDLLIASGSQVILSENSILVVYASNPETDLFPSVSGYGGETDGCIAEFDTSLNLTNLHIYGGTGNDYLFRCKPSSDSGFYLIGVTTSDDINLELNYNDGIATDYWILRLNKLFQVVWSKNFGGSHPCGELGCSNFSGDFVVYEKDVFLFVKNTVPASFPDYDIECGHSNDLIDADTDAWLVVFNDQQIDSSEQTSEFVSAVYDQVAQNIVLSFSDDFPDRHIRLSIFNVMGEYVYSDNDFPQNTRFISVNEFASGIYFVEVKTSGYATYLLKFLKI